LDKDCVSRMRVGIVDKRVGRRVHVKYWDSEKETDDIEPGN